MRSSRDELQRSAWVAAVAGRLPPTSAVVACWLCGSVLVAIGSWGDGWFCGAVAA
jgi:hypothetical protein